MRGITLCLVSIIITFYHIDGLAQPVLFPSIKDVKHALHIAALESLTQKGQSPDAYTQKAARAMLKDLHIISVNECTHIMPELMSCNIHFIRQRPGRAEEQSNAWLVLFHSQFGWRTHL